MVDPRAARRWGRCERRAASAEGPPSRAGISGDSPMTRSCPRLLASMNGSCIPSSAHLAWCRSARRVPRASSRLRRAHAGATLRGYRGGRCARVHRDATLPRTRVPDVEFALWIVATVAHAVIHNGVAERPEDVANGRLVDELVFLLTRYLKRRRSPGAYRPR